MKSRTSLAIVVIGRNEGERLRRCIDTLLQISAQIVYVDSGSTDSSVQMARSRQVYVVDLDMSSPFSASRARNTGFRAARREFPDAQFVQFVDGDCDVAPTWLATGVAFLESRPDVVAVYGALSERHPEHSLYNLHCHHTWNPGEAGETDFFGGNFMARTTTFEAVDGFREDVIDSEDHELAVRMRLTGGKVWYLDAPMAIHDLAMSRFSQWWRRTLLGGYGNGQVVSLHRSAPGRPHQQAWYRSWLWGFWLPAFVLVLTVLIGPLGLLPLLLYSVSFVRTYVRRPEAGGRHAGFALLSIFSNFAEATGQARFLLDRLGGRSARIVKDK